MDTASSQFGGRRRDAFVGKCYWHGLQRREGILTSFNARLAQLRQGKQHEKTHRRQGFKKSLVCVYSGLKNSERKCCEGRSDSDQRAQEARPKGVALKVEALSSQ